MILRKNEIEQTDLTNIDLAGYIEDGIIMVVKNRIDGILGPMTLKQFKMYEDKLKKHYENNNINGVEIKFEDILDNLSNEVSETITTFLNDTIIPTVEQTKNTFATKSSISELKKLKQTAVKYNVETPKFIKNINKKIKELEKN